MSLRSRIELGASQEEVLLLQLIPDNAKPLFALIDCNRDHLSQGDDQTAKNYPDEESVRESIVNPNNPYRLRFGIWWNDRLTGSINIEPKRYDLAVFEIGYWLGSEFCGIGIATFATRRIVDFAFNNLRAARVIAHTGRWNEKSANVLLRAGFLLDLSYKQPDELRYVFERSRYYGGSTK